MNNTLYIAVGLPGSGKSTYAKDFIKGKDIEYLSSDSLRAVYGKGEDDQTVTPIVFGHTSTRGVSIAKRWDSSVIPTDFFDGMIPVTIVYNKAISANDITLIYSQFAPGYGLS